MELKKLLKHLLTISLFFSCLSLIAQKYVPEYLHAHFDRTFYIAGEDMWYSVYFLNPYNRQSEIIHVELVAPDGTYLMRQTLKVQDDRTHGDFALPPNLKRGYYQFRAYTNWNLNFLPQEIYSEYIAIFPAELSKEKPVAVALTSDEPTDPQELISLNKNSFSPREEIQLNLKEMNGVGSVSIVDLRFVRDIDRNRIVERTREVSQKPIIPPKGGEPEIKPEKSYSKTFMLRQPGSEEYVTSNFIAGFVQQTHQKLMRPSTGGIVTFEFKDFYDSTVIQFFDANPFKATYIPLVSVINDDIPIDPPEVSNKKPELTPQIYRYIRDYQKRFQLNNLFGNRNNMRANKPEVIPSTIKPTTSYKVDDFIGFTNVTDFVKHTVPPVKLKTPRKKSGEKPQFKLYVPHKEIIRGIQVVEKPPLLLVNDYFTYDTEAVLNLPWENVLQVDVFNTAEELPLQFGPIGDFGVIAFQTRDGQTPPSIRETENNLKIEGFYLPRKFEMPTSNTSRVNNSRVPNLRPILYWNPYISLTKEEDRNISIPAGDQPGKYLIQFEGVSKEGKAVYAEAIFEISVDR
jgi:hypothetical protein